MSPVLLATGLALLAFPGALGGRAGQLRPSEWGRMAFASLWLGLRTLQAGLLVAATPAVLITFGVEGMAEVCHRMLGATLPGGLVVGWISAAAFVALTVRSSAARRAGVRQQRGARVEPWVGDHRAIEDLTLVTLPTTEVLAYAASGHPGQVVISEGVVAALTPEELGVVIDHERAHLRAGHSRYLLLAALLEASLGWLPGVRSSVAEVRLSIERWADEAAARRPGAREVVRMALIKTVETMLGPVPAFTTACTIAERLDALGSPPTSATLSRRAALAAPLLLLVGVVGACVVLWSTYTHHGVLGVIGFCPF